ncbi:hypothetical protein QMZ92_22070 [Streptomyces sp. HNM0645]|nr:hypothetical protein [Streptomyces sp. HNM0645]MDI9886980.1 hypothetical protein [Streptomyces sp. HNM0645]
MLVESSTDEHAVVWIDDLEWKTCAVIRSEPTGCAWLMVFAHLA